MSVYHGIILVVLNIIISAVLLIDVKLELEPPFYIKSGILSKNSVNYVLSFIYCIIIYSGIIILSVLIKNIVLAINLIWVLLILQSLSIYQCYY